MLYFRPLVVSVTFGCCLLALGCGGSHELQTAEVSGTVTFDGRPLPHGEVVAMPAKGRAARGVIQPDGSFVLFTYSDGDGAVVGKHTVTVTCVEKLKSSAPSVDDVALSPHRSLIPQRYADPATSGLTFEVKAGQKNELKLELTSRGGANTR